MAITYTAGGNKFSEGASYRVFKNLIPDTSYPGPGGYPLDKTQLGLVRIDEVTVVNNPSGVLCKWDKTTQKLIMGQVGGGVPGAFLGDAMPTHNHTIIAIDEEYTAIAGHMIVLAGAAGVFTIGETITGGTSGATGTVIAATATGTEVRYTPVLGRFDIGELVTGGTSGTIKSCQSMPFRAYNWGPRVWAACQAIFEDDGQSGRQYSPINVQRTYTTGYLSTIVGNFAPGELITGGTSGATGTITTQPTATGGGILIFWHRTGTFQSGETITGGSSGATAVLAQFIKNNSFYSDVTALRFAIDADIAEDTVLATGILDNSIQAASAGTPTGTIVGGGGGSFTEFTPGFNVRAILPNFDVIVEGV